MSGRFLLFLFSSLIVECPVYLLEMLIGDVSVDLRRGDGSVSEHRLDASDIRSVCKEIGREGMSERMRMDILDDTGLGGGILDDALDAAGCQAETFSTAVARLLCG